MLPSSLIILTITLFAPLISASSPVCSPSTSGLEITKFLSSYNNFCSKSTITNSTTAEIDIAYVAKSDGGCTKEDCLKGFGSLMQTCKPPIPPNQRTHLGDPKQY